MPDDVLLSSDKVFAERMDAANDSETRLKAFEDWCETKSGLNAILKYVAYLAETNIKNSIVEEFAWEAIEKAYQQVLLGNFKYRGCGFTAYVKTIAHNDFVDGVRRRKSTELPPDKDEYVRAITDTMSMDETLIYDEGLAEILKPLTERKRQILVLHYIQDYKHAEIAVILGISEVLVRQECHRAAKKLRKVLNKVTE